jgi:hypothetical protein
MARGRPAPLPPLSLTCPMHPDVVEAAPGSCPLCKMNLVPVRLGVGWTCPLHAVVSEEASGTCRICGRALVQATVALTWSCRGEEKAAHLEPGLCGDGSPRIGIRTLRPHGNHNPKYGGQFFMAPDSWHHLEGTLPRARVFRLYLYDDYARALTADKLAKVRARVVTKETFDSATRTTTDVTAFPLRMSRDGALEARIDTTSFPAAMTAKVRFSSDTPEYRFDFTFTALSDAPAPTPPAAVTARRATARGALPARQAPTTAALLDPLVPAPVPDTMAEILAQIRTRHRQVGELIARGEFGSVWVPAFQVKDLAIALEPHVEHIGAGAQRTAEPAIQDVVRAAWRIDAVGDLGNRQQIEDAYARLSAAVTAVLSAFEGLR